MDTTTNSRIEPYSPEWFKLRCGTFTASEAWKLMTEPRAKKDTISKTAETYILEKVHEKITGQMKMGIDNFATQWGVEHEPLAAKWYAKLTGSEVGDPYMEFHPQMDYFSCTPDRYVNNDGLIEIKCPANGSNHFKHCFITNDEFFKNEHSEYYWQCQSQMAICKKDWCDFVSFDPRVNTDLGMFIYRLYKNTKDIELLETKVRESRELFDKFYVMFGSADKNQ